ISRMAYRIDPSKEEVAPIPQVELKPRLADVAAAVLIPSGNEWWTGGLACCDWSAKTPEWCRASALESVTRTAQAAAITADTGAVPLCPSAAGSGSMPCKRLVRPGHRSTNHPTCSGSAADF